MNERDQDLAVSTGAYVLHALEPDEASQLEERAAHSETLRSEIAELSDTAVEIGLAVVPEAAPASLRADLLARIAETPQLPAARPASVTSLDDTRRRRRLPRPVAILIPIAAAAAIVTVIGVRVFIPDASASRVAAVASAPDVRSTTVQVHDGGTLRISWSDKLDAAAVRADHLPRLTSDKTYELWYLDGDSARPAGTFDGTGSIALSGVLRTGDRIAMTVEPAGGSTTPSGDPIALAQT